MKRLTSLLISLFILISSVGIAQVPRVINYQGKLLGSDEQPVAEKDYKLTFLNSLTW